MIKVVIPKWSVTPENLCISSAKPIRAVSLPTRPLEGNYCTNELINESKKVPECGDFNARRPSFHF